MSQSSRKPNSVRLARRCAPCGAQALGATIIPLVSPLLAGSSDRPGSFGRAVLKAPPYLVLLRAGFCLPPVLPRARCALTAPFHPYPFAGYAPQVNAGPGAQIGVSAPASGAAHVAERERAVYFLCHFPSGYPDRALPGALPCGVRTFLPRRPADDQRTLSSSGDRLAACCACSSADGASGERPTIRLAGLRYQPLGYPSDSCLI